MKLPKVVTISGGSGGFIVCRALRPYRLDITAIPSVFDSGGSTGVLRDTYGALPKGDVRRCFLGLMGEDQHEWRQLLNFRFDGDGDFSDHSFGNVMLLVAEKLWGREGGVNILSGLLNTKGRVVPVSTDSAELCAELSDGQILCGESVIDTRTPTDPRSINRIFLDPPAGATRSAINAILEADVVVFSPGDLFTSLLPNFLVDGVVDALNETKAKLVYVVNLMTKASETRGFTAEQFAYQLYRYGLKRSVDYLVVNSAPIPEELVRHYAKAEQSEVVSVPNSVWHDDELLCSRVVRSQLLSQRGLKEKLVRHSSKALGQVILEIINKRYERNVIMDLDDTIIETTEHTSSGQPGYPPLINGAERFLTTVRGQRALLTMGEESLQFSKLENSGILGYFDKILITSNLDEKRNVLESLSKDGYATANTMVVDDRPDGAIPFSTELGYNHTVRFSNPLGKYRHMEVSQNAAAPKFVCSDYRTLHNIYALN